MKSETQGEEILARIKRIYGLGREDIAVKMGYTTNYLSDVKKKGITNKFLNALRLNFPEAFAPENANNTFEARDEGLPYTTESPDYSSKAILNLTESNRLLAEAFKVQCEAAKIQSEASRDIAQASQTIANANRDLVTLVKNVTANAPVEIREEIDEKFAGMLKLVAKIGVGKEWHSEEEGLAYLARTFYQPAQAARH